MATPEARRIVGRSTEEKSLAVRSVFLQTNCSGIEEARALAETLLRENLAACVSIVPAAESYYRWQGEVHCDKESMLWIKTRSDLAERAVCLLQQHHSYDLPVISVIAVEAVTQKTRAWLEAMGEKQTQKQTP